MRNHTGIRVPILSYHAILENDREPLPPLWSRPHAVSLAAFRAQLDMLVSDGWHTVLPQALQQPELPPKCVVLTFDDAHASDLLAASELRRRGLQATFFITCSRIGSPGFLNRSGVLELARQGFGIGSHGVNHVRLADLAPEEMQRELVASRRQLQCLVHRPVTSVAVPFGSYNSRVVASAVALGYRAIMTSDFGMAIAGEHVLSRLGVRSRTTPKDFRGLLSGSVISIGRLRLVNGLKRRLMGQLSISD